MTTPKPAIVPAGTGCLVVTRPAANGLIDCDCVLWAGGLATRATFHGLPAVPTQDHLFAALEAAPALFTPVRPAPTA